jgi:hypothetical protein
MNETKSNTEIYLSMPGNRLAKRGAMSWPCSLTHVVEAAAYNIDDEAINPLPRHRNGDASEAKRLLALLSWSYAREVYNSEQILACLAGDPLGEGMDGGAPDCSELRRFRAENRAGLHVCLLAALRFLAEEKLAQGVVTRIDESHLAAEAERRIVTAMFLDTLALPNPWDSQGLARC